MKTQKVFDIVANKYDLMNDVMSAGAHRYWKECMIDWLSPLPGMKIIDVAGGTGDISSRFLKRISAKGEATVCDPNSSMIKYGKKKNKFSKNINWVTAPAETLPFENEIFDAYLVSFGIRNFSDIQKALDEAHRVLKKGGRFLCLEFSTVQNQNLSKLYNVYSKIIPVFGKVIVGDEKPYEYLTKTIRNFPSQEKFKNIIEESNFSKVEYRNIFNGVVAIHSGWKEI